MAKDVTVELQAFSIELSACKAVAAKEEGSASEAEYVEPEIEEG